MGMICVAAGMRTGNSGLSCVSSKSSYFDGAREGGVSRRDLPYLMVAVASVWFGQDTCRRRCERFHTRVEIFIGNVVKHGNTAYG